MTNNDILIGIILGIVEGLTEFIPVSSTGHLVLFGDYLDFHGERAKTFEIFIQLGAILAVLCLYKDRFLALIPRGSNLDGGFKGVNGIYKLSIASLPVLLLGALFSSSIKEHLFNSYTVAFALIVGGIVMLLVDTSRREIRVDDIENLSYKDCLIIGLFQCVSLWPGISRSGSTIVGGLLRKCSRKVAAEFSFILAVPVMFAATAYDMLKSIKFLSVNDIPLFTTGFVISFITAIIAVRFFLSVISKWSLAPFGVYRIVVGVIVLIALEFI